MTTYYNHLYSINFTVVSENPAENVTADELRGGLVNRLHTLGVGDEIIEACGEPLDTFEESGS